MKIQIVINPLTGDEDRSLQSDVDNLVTEVSDSLGGFCFVTGELLKDGSRYYAITRDGDVTQQEMTDRWKEWRDQQYGDQASDQEKEDDYGPVPRPESWQRLS